MFAAYRRRAQRSEGGFVLVWFAFLMILFLAIAAFVVDLMHAYSQAQQVQNAADAAATAGVVHRPSFTDAEARAVAVGEENLTGDPADSSVLAFPTASDGVTPLLSNQLRVQASKTFDTFFGNILNAPRLTVTREATAEYDPPIPLGSPLNTFGREVGCGGGPACSPDSDAWASVSGPLTSKRNGNAGMARWCDNPTWGTHPSGRQPNAVNQNPYQGGTGLNTDNCALGGTGYNNTDYEIDPDTGQPVQYFVIDVQAGATGARVEIFDPHWVNVQLGCNKADFLEFVDRINSGTDPLLPDLSPEPRWVKDATSAAGAEYCTGDNAARWNMPDGTAVNATTGIPITFEQNTTLCGGPPGVFRQAFYECMDIDGDAYGGAFFGGSDQVDDAIDQGDFEMDTTFTVLAPDGTPFDPTDNTPVAGCSETFEGFADINRMRKAQYDDHGITGMPGFRQWVELNGGACRLNTAGRYFLAVTGGTGAGQNQFSLAVSSIASRFGDTNIRVNPFQRFGLYVNEPDSAGEFYLARVLPASVTRTLQLSFFDMGDIPLGGSGSVRLRILPPDQARVGGPAGPIMTTFSDCSYDFPPGNASGPTPWRFGQQFTPDAATNMPNCEITGITQGTFNGQWINVEVEVPSSYWCDANVALDCWLTVEVQTLNGGGGPGGRLTDTTTWSAQFLGGPVRLTR